MVKVMLLMQYINNMNITHESGIKKFVAVFLILAMFFVFTPRDTHAQGIGLFGGPVAPILYCTCSGNWLVYIGPPRAGIFTYYTGVQSYLTYNMPFARYALGFYVPGAGICLIYVGFTCATVPAQGAISNFTGSSSI